MGGMANAQPGWNLVGNWQLGWFVEDGIGGESINIASEDCNTGVLTGSCTYHTFQGQITNSSVQFTLAGNPDSTYYLVGTVAADGTLSGTVAAYFLNGEWGGNFSTVSGQAVSYSVPVFAVQPVSQIISAGQSVTFTALATGNPTASLQWRFNGVDIANATNSSYSLSSTSVTNLGLYDVVASNCPGTNVSMMASLSFVNMQCFPGLVLYGPPGMIYSIQAASAPGGGSQWTTITNITLTSAQPYIYIDYSAITNGSMFYRAVPQ